LARSRNAQVPDADMGRRVWSLMAQDFHWSREALSKLRIEVKGSSEVGDVKLQTFEVVVTAVFARLRPDYDWWVTPNLPDGGVDFIGRGVFLASKELGIDAAITIGGQCKKRERVDDVVGELAGSLVRMAQTVHPTFFVAAFSAPLSPKRVVNARTILENTLRLHCHILDRSQLESLIGANLTAAKPIIRNVFPRVDAELVLDYFKKRAAAAAGLAIHVSAPSSVLAGEPFRVNIRLSRSAISGQSWRLRWLPSPLESWVTLLAPLGADLEDGVELDFRTADGEDPFILDLSLEFLVYAVGSQPLGMVEVRSDDGSPEAPIVATLPTSNVADNLRPPFYDVPYREALDEIQRGLVRAGSGQVCCVAITGAGGAGKTRLCEEICLEARRHGARIVSARQANSTDFPRRILANLLLGLAAADSRSGLASTQVDDVLRRLEPSLATRARSAVEALYDEAGKAGSRNDDQSLLSVLAVLIAQRCRVQTLIIHLHDLHWCTLDVLELIDRLIWQLSHLSLQVGSEIPGSGLRVLFLLEGRTHEYRESAETGWSTRMFERFIERLACPIARCRAFDLSESAVFAHRLFEQRHTAHRILPTALFELQQHLIDSVHRAAGGNPFHMLEYVKLLQQHGILAQNPRTGFIHMVRPDFGHIPLPQTVFETIEARWRYYWVNDRNLALLLWSAALVDDSLPAGLFRHLWSQLAPDVTQPRLESTEFLRFSKSGDDGLDVSFRHENYFQTLRRVQVPARERQAIVEVYSLWFRQSKSLSPVMRYVQARVELEAPAPNLQHVRGVLRAALQAALRRQDRSLASRILVTLLDEVTWPTDQRRPLLPKSLMRACSDEITLCRDLIRAGQGDIAQLRIQRTLAVIESRLCLDSLPAPDAGDYIRRCRFTLSAMRAGILFNDRRPAEAVAITDMSLKELRLLLEEDGVPKQNQWTQVLMEVQHTHSVALAVAGDLKRAVMEGRKAASIAETLLDVFPDALDVIITYANILLCEAPEQSELLLERYRSLVTPEIVSDATRLRLDLHLSMSRIVVGHKEAKSGEGGSGRLEVARDTLVGVFRRAHPLGRIADAAAAALLVGLIDALRGRPEDIDWFSQAAALAMRARQLDTLWRANINLAHSLHRDGQSAYDPAAAALDIITSSLNSYGEPDRNPRFDLVCVPMAHAVRFLILAGNETTSSRVLTAFPALRRFFADLKAGTLKDDRDGRSSHEWFRVGDADYVLY
jgi:hypothetical protein